MSRYTISTDTDWGGAERTTFELGSAYAVIWHYRGAWESAHDVAPLSTRDAAVAAEVAWLRQRAADMLALAEAMETGRAADQVVDEDLDDCR